MKISVITQLYNRVDLFSETIASVLAQSYPIHEFIIIDDGSTENVKAVLDKFNDPRIKYFYFDRIGVISKLRNIGLSKATGDVIAFIDSDDLWHVDKLKIHVEDMIATGAVISFSDCRLFNTEGWVGPSVCHDMNKVNLSIFKEVIEHNQSLAFGTNIFFKRQQGEPFLKFDERLFLGEHDFTTMLMATNKVTYIDSVLNYIRRHDRNISTLNILEIISPLEFNRTLEKLLLKQKISKRLYKKIKAANYSKVGFAYFNRQRAKMSVKFLSAAILLNPRWSYIKVFLKCLSLFVRKIKYA